MQTSTPTSAIELYRELVMLDGDEGYTTSIKIAARFGRPHKVVLKSIDRINRAIKSRGTSFTREIFKDFAYIDSRGKAQRQFLVSKDGFLMLAMRFDGDIALDWQLNFVAAFNWLVDQVQERAENNRLIAQFDIKNRESIADGSYHGAGLQRRKVEKEALEAEELAIKAKTQSIIDFDGGPAQIH